MWIVIAGFSERVSYLIAWNALKKHKIKQKNTTNFMNGEIELRVSKNNVKKAQGILRSVGIGDLYLRTYWLDRGI